MLSAVRDDCCENGQRSCGPEDGGRWEVRGRLLTSPGSLYPREGVSRPQWRPKTTVSNLIYNGFFFVLLIYTYFQIQFIS